LRLNETGKALQYYENLVNKHPDYVGTYYHLGKLYEALNRKPDAINIYEKGMEIAKKKRDNHAFAELQTVYREANGIDEDDL
jgi:tetratricopeptide (TPR) repeat protein